MKKTISGAVFFSMLFMAPLLQAASVSEEVVGTAYDASAITALPGSPEVRTLRGTSADQVRQRGGPGPSSAVPEVKTYEELRRAISEARAQSRTRVEKAVEQERVREAWEIGRLIDAHVLQHKERADYGKQVILRLSRDLGMSDTELYYMLQFARTYPNFRAPGKLSWGHYETLLSVNDPKERAELEEKAAKENWTQNQTRAEVRRRKAALKGTGSPAESGVPVPLEAKPGKPGTYRVIQAFAGPYKGQLALDLGFSNYLSLEDSSSKRWLQEIVKNSGGRRGATVNDFRDRQIVESAKGKLKRSDRTEADLFTYEADVYRVLDGDTVMAVVDLGFGITTTQTLRLRGIDCPELLTADGREAKEFVESVIATSRLSGDSKMRGKQSILIKTVKSDKYDRYLADVFVTDKEGKTQYLNNRLLEEGHAVRVSE